MVGIDALIDKPHDNEIEFTVIGGNDGFGESVLVRISEGKWIVVDSCVDRKKRCLPLLYLQEIGVDLHSDILCVCCTHWHADHIRGMRQLLEVCSSNTKLCIALPEDRKRFLVECGKLTLLEKDHSVTKELFNIMHVAENNHIPVKRIIQDQLVFQTDNAQCFALSPSQTDLQQFLEELAAEVTQRENIEKQKEALRAIPESKIVSEEDMLPKEYKDVPLVEAKNDEKEKNAISDYKLAKINERSVALMLTLNGHTIILGADLEIGKDGNGWKSVVEDCECIKNKRAEAYKIPHHGSSTGYYDAFVIEHVAEDCIGKVTTWMLGGNILPNNEMLDTYSKSLSALYLSSVPELKNRAPQNTAQIKKTIKPYTNVIQSLSSSIGIIQSRLNISADTPVWRTACFGSAFRYK